MEEIPITDAKLAEYETFVAGFAVGMFLMAFSVLLFSGSPFFWLPLVKRTLETPAKDGVQVLPQPSRETGISLMLCNRSI